MFVAAYHPLPTTTDAVVHHCHAIFEIADTFAEADIKHSGSTFASVVCGHHAAVRITSVFTSRIP